MTWLRVVISVVVGGVDDDIVDYVLDDVGTDVLVVGGQQSDGRQQFLISR